MSQIPLYKRRVSLIVIVSASWSLSWHCLHLALDSAVIINLPNYTNIFTAQCTLVQSASCDRMLTVCLWDCDVGGLWICDHLGWKSRKLIAQTISPTSSLFVAKRRSTYPRGTWGNFMLQTRGGVGKSGVLGNKSGNISETRKDRGNCGRPIGTHRRSFEWYHPRPPTLTLFQFSLDWRFATPTRNSNKKSWKQVRICLHE